MTDCDGMNNMDEQEFFEIKAVCDKYGYGNVMTLASNLWEHELAEAGVPTSLAFAVTCINLVKKKGLELKRLSDIPYKAVIKKFLG